MKVTNNNDNLSEFLTKSIKQLRKQECMINEEGQKLLTSVFFLYICSDISYNNISHLPKDVFCCLGSLKYL